MCGIDLGALLITAVIIGLIVAIIQLIFPKVPFLGGLVGQIVSLVLWAIIAILIIKAVIIPLLSCAGL